MNEQYPADRYPILKVGSDWKDRRATEEAPVQTNLF